MKTINHERIANMTKQNLLLEIEALESVMDDEDLDDRAYYSALTLEAQERGMRR